MERKITLRNNYIIILFFTTSKAPSQTEVLLVSVFQSKRSRDNLPLLISQHKHAAHALEKETNKKTPLAIAYIKPAH